MEYAATVGSRSGRLLPTGNPIDVLALEDGTKVEVTIGDAANPCVFFDASALGLTGSELPTTISGRQDLIETIGEIQGKAGVLMGIYRHWQDQHLPGLPLAILVARASEYADANGQFHSADSMDVRERLVFLGKCHDSMAGAGAMCSGAISRVVGTVLNRVLNPRVLTTQALRIGHPLGVMDVKVQVSADSLQPEISFNSLSFPRTARRLMQGEVLVPSDVAW